ncbi:acetyltransferase (GNAT) family protein [Nocardiopsis sp. Huas11]|uniref:GNAT family N-acetyltransferase n=1 Tax=Nocardiopsis sp. Huas11 TaxID=2183912 RepID=UPI000F208333|nr:GNAT family N-acetyltransferase [Nocardiopsis sp. Huas11]RKS04776.1 acetyltransferase (GNAT) family protein [Nocardiopsis sp. Huas11]
MREWSERIAGDWPPAEVETAQGWRLGYGGGVTFRANSAYALDPGAPGPLAAVERFFHARGAPAAVQIWPGMDDLDADLADRGFTAHRAALVMVRDIGGARAPREGFEVLARPDARWCGLWPQETADPRVVEGQHRIMDRVPVMGYAVDTAGNARGCGALGEGWVGLYNMLTAASARGRGLAGGIIDSLLVWGRDKGAHSAYLLVVRDNVPALRAYERAGFAEVARYHYRVGPAPGA